MKIYNKLIILLTISVFFNSCSNNDELINDNVLSIDNTSNKDIIQAKESSKTKNIESDIRFSKLNKLGKEYSKLMTNRNSKEILSTHKKIKKLLNELIQSYGEENLYALINEKVNENKKKSKNISNRLLDESGDKCKRNSDGTVDYDACEGFWENVLVTVRVDFCPDHDAEALYDCAQDAVCKTC